jgi:very-short-patch-repair endonuclease
VRRDVDDAIGKLAMPRAGAFCRDEVYEAGGDYQLVWRRERAGTWRHRGADAMVLAAYPETIDQRRWVGLLAGGSDSHLSFETAAEIHRIDGARRGLVVVTVRHPLHLIVDGVIYHQLVDVAPHHLTVVDGWPVTTPARTLVDLAAVLSRTRLGVAIEDCVVRRLATFTDIDRVVREVRRRGKPGVRKLVTVLDERDGEPPPESELERLLIRAAQVAQVPIVRQHPLPTREPIRGLVDCAIVESKIILEADSRSWHARLQAMTKDRQRDRGAARLGWVTLRFMYQDLVNDLAGCADDIAATHRQRTGA